VGAQQNQQQSKSSQAEARWAAHARVIAASFGNRQRPTDATARWRSANLGPRLAIITMRDDPSRTRFSRRSDAARDRGIARRRRAGVDLRLRLLDVGSRIPPCRGGARIAARLSSPILPLFLRLSRNPDPAWPYSRPRSRRGVSRDRPPLAARNA